MVSVMCHKHVNLFWRLGMPRRNPRPETERQIHIKLPEATHKRLRIHAATLDTSMQDWVVKVIEGALGSAKRKGKRT